MKMRRAARRALRTVANVVIISLVPFAAAADAIAAALRSMGVPPRLALAVACSCAAAGALTAVASAARGLLPAAPGAAAAAAAASDQPAVAHAIASTTIFETTITLNLSFTSAACTLLQCTTACFLAITVLVHMCTSSLVSFPVTSALIVLMISMATILV